MFRTILTVTSSREGDIIDITPQVEKAVAESRIKTGLVHLFVQHSTAALTTIEYEPGVLADLKRALSVLAPDNEDYAHNSRWGDGNGRSHVKAALVGPSITVPVENGQLDVRDLAAARAARTRCQRGQETHGHLHGDRLLIRSLPSCILHNLKNEGCPFRDRPILKATARALRRQGHTRISSAG